MEKPINTKLEIMLTEVSKISACYYHLDSLMFENWNRQGLRLWVSESARALRQVLLSQAGSATWISQQMTSTWTMSSSQGLRFKFNLKLRSELAFLKSQYIERHSALQKRWNFARISRLNCLLNLHPPAPSCRPRRTTRNPLWRRHLTWRQLETAIQTIKYKKRRQTLLYIIQNKKLETEIQTMKNKLKCIKKLRISIQTKQNNVNQVHSLPLSFY